MNVPLSRFSLFSHSSFPMAPTSLLAILILSVQSGCVSSSRQDLFDSKLVALERRLAAAEEGQKSLSSFKNTTEDVNKRTQAYRTEMDELKKQLAMARGSVDEIQMKMDRLKEVQDETSRQLRSLETQALQTNTTPSSPSTPSGKPVVPIALLEILSAHEKSLASLQAKMIWDELETNSKTKLKKKTAAEVTKELGVPFAERDYKKVVKISTSLLSLPLAPEAREAALEFRAESHFLQKAYQKASSDFLVLIDQFPQFERRARALLLAGDSFAFQKRFLVAAGFYREASEQFADKDEGKQASQRLANVAQRFELQ